MSAADPSVGLVVDNMDQTTNEVVRVTATFPLRHRCPFKDEDDCGDVTIVWHGRYATFELHALAAVLATWHDVEVSHEVITEAIHDRLTHAARGADLHVVSVTTRWATAGGTIEVVVPVP